MLGIPITPDLQAKFDTVVRGLAAQEWRQSLHERHSPACGYRGQDGRKCALGQLIPDDLYLKGMEGDIDTLYNGCWTGTQEHENLPLVLAHLPSLEVAGLWQGLHDDNVTPTSMHDAFREHAVMYGFTWPAEVP